MPDKVKFDPVEHRYWLDDREVPSVTQVIKAVLPGSIPTAGEWYLERGRAVHACAALVAQGKRFEHDPAIDGQVQACHRFFSETGFQAVEVERIVSHPTLLYAGTLDAVVVGGPGQKRIIVDWKSSIYDAARIQVGGYGLATGITAGMVVALGENGIYGSTGVFRLESYAREFAALRGTYGVLERLGLLPRKEEG